MLKKLDKIWKVTNQNGGGNLEGSTWVNCIVQINLPFILSQIFLVGRSGPIIPLSKYNFPIVWMGIWNLVRLTFYGSSAHNVHKIK
jgi:hypothetical protein